MACVACEVLRDRAVGSRASLNSGCRRRVAGRYSNAGSIRFGMLGLSTLPSMVAVPSEADRSAACSVENCRAAIKCINVSDVASSAGAIACTGLPHS